MAAITAAQVKSLRDETGLPMMECKSALTEANGDTDQAKQLLQKKYKGKMAARAANETAEGCVVIYISDDKTHGAIVDLRCETAPVAKTDRFVELGETLARSVDAAADAGELSVEAALALPSVSHDGRTLSDEITDAFGQIRENIKFAGCRRLSGPYLCGYVHHDVKSGVLVALDAVPNPESVGTDLCHHVTFSNPMAIRGDELPADEVEKVRAMAREIAVSEGKPDHIIDKIVDGKVRAFRAENALLEQEHVKVSKTTVAEVLKAGGVGDVVAVAYYKIGS